VELRQLEHFVAVADAKHFTRAAEDLSISQSGLSASIRALERELRASLFRRNTRRVELTDAGRALLGECRRTLASAAAAREAVAATQGLLRGTLTVGAEQCVGALDVPKLLSAFRSEHPGVEIRFRQGGTATLLEELHGGQLDVAAVATSAQSVPGLRLFPVASEPMQLLCPREHPFASRGVLTLEEIGAETLVDFQAGWGARRISDQGFAAAGCDHRTTLEVGDVHTLLDLVRAGIGLALVPAPVARKKEAAELVAVAVKDDALADWQISLAVPEAASTLAAEAFLQVAAA
jgi:DNA-binding transcriptional LysR family regulator